MDTVEIGAFPLGVDNRSPDVVSRGAAAYIEGATIVAPGGAVASFGRLDPVMAGNMHSGFTTSSGETFCVKDGVWGGFDGESFRPVVGTPGLVKYVEGHGRTYVLMAQGLYYLDQGSMPLRRAGIRKPDSPSLTALGAGRLEPGSYGVAISVVDDRGEESPLSDPVFIELDNQGGIVLRGLPDIGDLSFRVYMTNSGGEELFLAIPSTPNSPTIVLGSPPEGGSAPDTGLDLLPGGDHICIYGGRILVSVGQYVLFSQPGDPHKTSAAYGYIDVGHRVVFLGSTPRGVVVGTTQGVIMLQGSEISDVEIVDLSDEPPVEGSCTTVGRLAVDAEILDGAEAELLWVDRFGFMCVTSSGKAVRVNGDRIDLGDGLGAGNTHIVYQDGRAIAVNLVEFDKPVGDPYGITY